MSVIAIINQKGGVGKTTLTANLAAALAKKQREVLVIDLDPQANLTAHFGFQPETLEWTLYNVLVKRPVDPFRIPNSIHQVILSPNFESVRLVPANLELSSAEIEMVSVMGRETLLKESIETLDLEYDYVLLDCPPSLGLLSMNALAAADEVLIPFQTEFFALKGLQQLLDVIDLVKTRKINKNLKIIGFVGCLYDRRKKLHRDMLASMKQQFGDQVLHTVVRNNVALAESAGQGVCIFDYDSKSHGASDYAQLAAELLKKR